MAPANGTFTAVGIVSKEPSFCSEGTSCAHHHFKDSSKKHIGKQIRCKRPSEHEYKL